jgi:hypothetical protein
MNPEDIAVTIIAIVAGLAFTVFVFWMVWR